MSQDKYLDTEQEHAIKRLVASIRQSQDEAYTPLIGNHSAAPGRPRLAAPGLPRLAAPGLPRPAAPGTPRLAAPGLLRPAAPGTPRLAAPGRPRHVATVTFDADTRTMMGPFSSRVNR